MLNTPFWKINKDTLIKSLHSDEKSGLSFAEAKKLLKKVGKNKIKKQKDSIWFSQIIVHFKNPLILLLLVVGAISLYLREFPNFIIISIITAISVTLDFYQEYKALSTIESLKRLVALKSTVIRDNQLQEIEVYKLVPGDIILLRSGDLVPADCKLIESKNLLVDQSSFTGEAYYVEKTAQPINFISTNNIADIKDVVFMGSTVIGGSAKALVCQTGTRTEFSKLIAASSSKPLMTAFEIGVKDFGLFIMRISILCSLAVLLINTALHKTLLESFIFAIAIAIGITPELLPMIFTVTIGTGIKEMVKERLVIKRPIAVQNLASMNILCTDKTGTLTEGKVQLTEMVNFEGINHEETLQLAYINSYFQQSHHSLLDDSIIHHKSFEIKNYQKIDEIPFDFERRMLSIIVKTPEQTLLVNKGSPENVINTCTHYQNLKEIKPLSYEIKTQIEHLCNNYFKKGYRVLALAYKNIKGLRQNFTVSDENELIFSGLIIFIDPPKISAKEALKKLIESGVDIKVITGDSELVARDICEKLNLNICRTLEGSEIQLLNDKALGIKAEHTDLFYKISPLQKSRIISALKMQGHVVGYLGDGINDAPSLHIADVGISVNTAVDAAKEASDIIMLDSELNLLYNAVLIGRKTFANIMKYLMVTTSSNFGNMLSMALGSLILPFLPMLPVQILINNLLYDIAEIPLPLDRVSKDYLKKPKKFDVKFIYKFMLIFGIISSVFDIITFYILLYIIKVGPEFFRTVWFLQSLASQVLTIFIFRTKDDLSYINPPLVLTLTIFCIISLSIILTLPPFAAYFGFATLNFNLFLFVVFMVGSYLLTIKKIKNIIFFQNNIFN